MSRSPSNPNAKPTWRIIEANADAAPAVDHADRLRRLLAVRIAASIQAELQTAAPRKCLGMLIGGASD